MRASLRYATHILFQAVFALSLNAQKIVQPDLGKRSVALLKVKNFEFKDLNKNGKLDQYEDWRLPADERAKDLASKMTVEQIAGLMLSAIISDSLLFI